MNEIPSSCEIPEREANTGTRPGSRILRWQDGFRWEGVPVEAYKTTAATWCGISRMPLAGMQGEKTSFHLRYFEIEPGAHSSLEHHGHEHVVFVLRGRGDVRLGETIQTVGFGDVVYIAPHEVHQLGNPSDEPFGFLCVVDAERDVPVPVDEKDARPMKRSATLAP